MQHRMKRANVIWRACTDGNVTQAFRPVLLQLSVPSVVADGLVAPKEETHLAPQMVLTTAKTQA
jgi:hypothetical protein